jgi:hypothetical protein
VTPRLRWARLALAAGVGTLAPGLAVAALPGNIAVDFSTGGAHVLYAKVQNVAWGLFFFFFVLTIVFEVLRPTNEAVRLGPPTIRAAAIGAALLLYPTLAGTIIKSAQALAERLGPTDTAFAEWYRIEQGLMGSAVQDPSGTMSRAPGSRLRAGQDYPTVRQPWPKTKGGSCPAGLVAQDTTITQIDEAMLGQDGSLVAVPAWRCVRPEAKDKDESMIVTGLKDAGLSVALLIIFAVMSAAKFLVEEVGAILTAVFYLLGPLALSVGVLKLTGTISAWLKAFITYASWPIFTNLLMSLVIAATSKPVQQAEGYVDALWIGLAVMLSMISAPVLASQLTGAAGAGFMSAAIGATSAAATGALSASAAVATGGVAAAAAGTGVGAVADAAAGRGAAAALGRHVGGRLASRGGGEDGGSVASLDPGPPAGGR